MKKFIIILTILILAFVALSIWAVKVYAQPLELADLKMTLIPEASKVFVKSNEGDFTEVTGEIELRIGDTVKTDGTGEARIVLFDANEVTLDKNSEVVLEKSFIDEETPFLTKIKLNLKQGQVWSRLLEFFHPDAYFEVEAGGVVATVRGTVFNVSYRDDEVDVSVLENSVAVSQKDSVAPTQIIKADEKLLMKLNILEEFEEARIEKIPSEIKGNEWFKKNFVQDERFKESIIKKQKKLFEQVGPLPGSKFYLLKQFGEKISLLLTFDKEARQNKWRSFEVKKILAAKKLYEQGDKRMALRILKLSSKDPSLLPLVRRFEYYDRDFLKKQVGILKQGTADNDFAKEYLKVFEPKELEFLNQKIKTNEFYPSWLEEMFKVNSEDIKTLSYLQEIFTAEDWKCFERIHAKSLEMQKILKEISPENVTQWSLAMQNFYTPEDLVCIERIQARFAHLRADDFSTQSLPLELLTNTASKDESTFESPPEPTNLEIMVADENITPQGNTALTAYLILSDGTSKDVTSETTWYVHSDANGLFYGEVRDNIFYSNGRSGQVTIKGSYTTDDNKTFTSSVVINVGF